MEIFAYSTDTFAELRPNTWSMIIQMIAVTSAALPQRREYNLCRMVVEASEVTPNTMTVEYSSIAAKNTSPIVSM